MRAPSTSTKWLSGFRATASRNQAGDGGGEPASGASGPWFSLMTNISVFAPATGGTGGRSSSALMAKTLARSGEPLKPCAMRMRATENALVHRPVVIVAKRQPVLIVDAPLIAQPPDGTAQARDGQDIAEGGLHVLRELIGDIAVINADRLICRNARQRVGEQLECIPRTDFGAGVLVDRERRFEPCKTLILLRPDQRAQPVAIIRIGKIDEIAL